MALTWRLREQGVPSRDVARAQRAEAEEALLEGTWGSGRPGAGSAAWRWPSSALREWVWCAGRRFAGGYQTVVRSLAEKAAHGEE